MSTGFFFLRPSASVYQLLDNWAANLEEVHIKGEQPPFSRALRGDLSRDLDMAVLPMAAFPSGKQSAVATEAEDSEVKQVRSWGRRQLQRVFRPGVWLWWHVCIVC